MTSGTPSPARRRWMVLATFLAAGVVTRVAVVALVADPSQPELWEFGKIARNLVETGTFSYRVPGVPSAWMPPAYPFIIAGAYTLFGVATPAAHWAVATLLLCGQVALPFLVAWVASLAWNRRVAAIAFALSCVWPSFLIMSGRLHCIGLYTSLLVGALGLYWTPRLSGWRRALAVGLTLGAYGVFRMEMPLLLGAFALALWHAERTRTTRARVGIVTILVASALLVVTPWVVRNWVVLGKPLLTTSAGYNLLRGHDAGATGGGRGWRFVPDGELVPQRAVARSPELAALRYDRVEDELIADEWYRERALSHVRNEPRKELELLARKVFFFLVADFTHPVQSQVPIWLPSLVALVLGAVAAVRSIRVDLRLALPWLIFGTQLAVSLVFFVLPRYRLVVDFVPVMFFAAWLAERLGEKSEPS